MDPKRTTNNVVALLFEELGGLEASRSLASGDENANHCIVGEW